MQKAIENFIRAYEEVLKAVDQVPEAPVIRISGEEFRTWYAGQLRGGKRKRRGAGKTSSHGETQDRTETSPRDETQDRTETSPPGETEVPVPARRKRRRRRKKRAPGESESSTSMTEVSAQIITFHIYLKKKTGSHTEHT